MTTIDIFVDRKTVILKETDTVLAAAKAMCQRDIGCVVVSKPEGQICGIVTDRDLVCNFIASELDPLLPLKRVMEADVVSLEEDKTVSDAIDLMKEHGIRRLPITETIKGKKARCVGLVTLDDLMASRLVSNEDLAQIIKTQILRKKRPSQKSGRSTSRKEQTYQRFHGQMAEAMRLNKPHSAEIVRFLLESIVRRLHYTGGAHLIAQLPKRFQEELLDLPAGPDRGVTQASLIQGVALRLGQSPKEAQEIIFQFWRTLEHLIGREALDHVLYQLPERIVSLLKGEARPLPSKPGSIPNPNENVVKSS